MWGECIKVEVDREDLQIETMAYTYEYNPTINTYNPTYYPVPPPHTYPSPNPMAPTYIHAVVPPGVYPTAASARVYVPQRFPYVPFNPGHAFVHQQSRTIRSQAERPQIRWKPKLVTIQELPEPLTTPPPGVRIFVKNLHYSVDDQRLREEFRQFGRVTSAQVVLKNDHSRGFGFVSFSSLEEATKAIKEMNGKMLMNRRLFVELAQTKEEREAFLAMQQHVVPVSDGATESDVVPVLDAATETDVVPVSDAATETDEVPVSDAVPVSNRPTYSAVAKARAPPKATEQKNNKPAAQKPKVPQKTEVIVKNLDNTVDDKQLRETFMLFGTVTSAKVVMKGGRSRGYGYVTFSSLKEASKAITEMNDKMMNKRPVIVDLKQTKSKRQAYLAQQEKQRMESRDAAVASDKATKPPKGVRIFVKNLHYSVDDQRLREEFRQFGTITQAEVMLRNYRSRGFGFVSFSSPEEATKAIKEMNGKMLMERPLFVELAETEEERKAFLAMQEDEVPVSDKVPVSDAATGSDEVPVSDAATETDVVPVSDAATETDEVPVSDAVPVSNRPTYAAVAKARAPPKATEQKNNKPAAQKPQVPQKTEVIVKNLEYAVDDKQLREMFMPFGTVTSAKVEMKDGHSRGFGFVNFSSPEEASKAIMEMNNKMMDKRPVIVELKQAKEERQAYLAQQAKRRMESRDAAVASDRATKPPKRTTVIVKNLDFAVDDKQLREQFIPFGTVSSAKVVMQDDHSQGFGFVTFSSPEEANKAITEMNDKMMGTRPMIVELVQSKAERQAYLAQQEKRRMESRDAAVASERATKPPKRTTVIVKNLDFAVDDKQLREQFMPFGTVSSAKVVMQDDHSRGFGFVTFSSPEEANKAITEMNEKMMGTRPMIVELVQSKAERQAYLAQQEKRRMESRDAAVASERATKPPKRTTVIVKNLDFAVDDKQLREQFMPFGTVSSAKVVMKDDHSRGFGFVTFSSLEEANKAITEMNEKMMGTRPMIVELVQSKAERDASLARQEQEQEQQEMESRTQSGTFPLSFECSTSLYTYCRKPTVDEPKPSTVSKRTTVIVRNLDLTVDDKELRKTFLQFGTVMTAKVAMVKGCPKGHGIVTFQFPDEAEKAVKEMNGKILGMKALQLSLQTE